MLLALIVVDVSQVILTFAIKRFGVYLSEDNYNSPRVGVSIEQDLEKGL